MDCLTSMLLTGRCVQVSANAFVMPLPELKRLGPVTDQPPASTSLQVKILCATFKGASSRFHNCDVRIQCTT